MRQVALAFSGSGFKVPAHVGALEAVITSGYKVVEMAGTSGGSIISSLYACGMSLDEMKTLSMTEDWSRFLSFDLSALMRGSFCSGVDLYEFLLDKTKGKKFKDLVIPLKVITSDVSTNTPFTFSKETTPDATIALAVRASASIPFVYSPVKYEDKILVDGGLVNNIPVDRLDYAGYKLGIQLHSNYPDTKTQADLMWPWKMVSRLLNLLIDSSENTHIREGQRKGAEIIFVETGFAEGLDTKMSTEIREKLYNSGYESTAKEILQYKVNAGRGWTDYGI